MSSGSALYAERLKRVMDAVELRQPDRVPTVFFASAIGIPDESRPENVRAMVESVRRYHA